MSKSRIIAQAVYDLYLGKDWTRALKREITNQNKEAYIKEARCMRANSIKKWIIENYGLRESQRTH